MTAPRAITIRQLDLTRFRSYPRLRLEIGPQQVVLTGANGAGKTNLLEAISLLMPGRGMRGAGFDAMLAKQPSLHQAHPEITNDGTVYAVGDPEPQYTPARQWGVSAKVDGPDGLVQMGTTWTQVDEGAATGRAAQLNGEKLSGTGAFSEHIRLIWLTPAMDRLFAGPASDRRRFLDRIVADIDLAHRQRLNTFDKLMRQRNVLLGNPPLDSQWLSVIEQQMAQNAIAIAAARLAAIDALQGYIEETHQSAGSDEKAESARSVFPKAQLSLDGQIEASLRDNPAVQSEDEYAKLLHDSRKLDQAAGRTLSGPHKTDLIVFHKDKQLEARSCSTGEQKALLTGMVLAQARMIRSVFFGFMPVLLLDEVAAHLDANRRSGLFDELLKTGAQSWMTGTDEMQFEALRNKAQFLTVTEGRVFDAR